MNTQNTNTTQKEPIYYYITDTLTVKPKTKRSKFYTKHKNCHNFFTNETEARKTLREIKKAYIKPSLLSHTFTKLAQYEHKLSDMEREQKDMKREHEKELERLSYDLRHANTDILSYKAFTTILALAFIFLVIAYRINV